MIQFIIGGLAGYLVANAIKKDKTSQIIEKSSKPTKENLDKVKQEDTIDIIRAYVNKEGNDVIIDLMKDSDFKNNPKFKDIGRDYVSAYNSLESQIKKLDKDEKEEIDYRIYKEGFDSAFMFYSDFKDITKSKSFHDARLNYIKQSKRVNKFLGFD